MSGRMVLSALCAALVTLTAVAAPASAQRDRDRDGHDRRDDRRDDDRRGGGDSHRGDEWVLLGSQSVGFRGDRDVIRVGRSEGRFESLVLGVKNGDVEIREMTVIFRNRERQTFTVNGTIRDGQRTRPIDLRGGDRVIESIEFVYRSVGARWRGDRATVEVYGQQHDSRGAGPGPGPRPGWGGRPEWVELGCRTVAFIGADRDVIPVGRREGRFKALKFRAKREKIRLLDARVIYTNGQPDDLRIDVDIPKNGETQPISVRGRTRSIDRVEVVTMKKKLTLKKVDLCVDGLQ
jgi:hypothetical protein